MSKLKLGLSILFVATLHSSNVAALQIEFDYRFDTGGFFTDLGTGGAITERRQILETAAAFYSGFTDQLTSVSTSGSDTWTVSISNPGQLGTSVTLVDEVIAADTIKIFVGGSGSAPGVLGFAGTGFNFNASGSNAFVDAVTTRGQGVNDYGIWGGSIWFNANNSWYFDEGASGLTPGHPDFLTTAAHEIGHILGYGTADSWFDQIDNNGFFTGENSVASYGGLVPVDQFGSHWAEGVSSVVDGVMQETMMDPSTTAGIRQLPTDLDIAGFADIGWEVAAVPLPAAIWLLLSAMSGLMMLPRRNVSVVG